MNRIRLRPGLHYAPIDGGVYLSSARATFVMSGPPVLFRVVDTCVPLLEDGTDVESLVDAMGTPAAGPLVAHLVTTLAARGLLLDLDRLRVGAPEPGERERFPEALAYLEAHLDHPYADFRRIRAARILVAGPPEALGTAARGLLRAGAGRVVAATPEPGRLAALAARHPGLGVVAWSEGGPLAALCADLEPQAAVVFTGDGFPAAAIESLPAGCRAVPVRLGKEMAIVGPAIVAGTTPIGGIEELWSRAATWCHRDGDDLLVWPSGDLLAGALASQMAFDALVGLCPGQVHVVHGGDLRADAITPALSGGAGFGAECELGPPGSVLASEPDAGRGWLTAVSQEWSGLFRLSVPGDLAQMPLALTLADGRSASFDGCAVGFGPDQDASTIEAALEGLRRHIRGRAGGDAGTWVHGAGRDETEWLLDGALRLLAATPGPSVPVDWLAIDDRDARRLWRTLEEYELVAVGLTERRVDDIGWVLVSVHDRGSGALRARGWGPTRAVAAVAALSCAIAHHQVQRRAAAADLEAAVAPGFHHTIHGPHRDHLHAAVHGWLAATGRHLRGRRLGVDPVAGDLGAWCGPVGLDD